MFKKYLTLILTFLILNLSLSATVFAETNAEKEAKFVEKVKTQITKLGIGVDAKVQVKLKNGTKLKGYVSQINKNSFVVVDDKTSVSTEIPYPQTKQIKGNNLNTGVKIAIVAGLVILIAVVVCAVSTDCPN